MVFNLKNNENTFLKKENKLLIYSIIKFEVNLKLIFN